MLLSSGGSSRTIALPIQTRINNTSTQPRKYGLAKTFIWVVVAQLNDYGLRRCNKGLHGLWVMTSRPCVLIPVTPLTATAMNTKPSFCVNERDAPSVDDQGCVKVSAWLAVQTAAGNLHL